MSKIEFDSILSNDDRYEIIEHNKISWVVTKSNTKLLIETIKKESVIDNNKELKNLDILFRKIENDN